MPLRTCDDCHRYYIIDRSEAEVDNCPVCSRLLRRAELEEVRQYLTTPAPDTGASQRATEE